METCYFSDFIDIADLTLHGDTEYIAITVIPYQEINDDHYE